LHDSEKIDVSISSLSLATLAYTSQRHHQNTRHVIKVLVQSLHVLPLETSFFHQTITSAFKSFEDGLQFFSALTVKGLYAIISRNKKDLTTSTIPVFNTGGFLKHLTEKT
jgi:hypothetical protein